MSYQTHFEKHDNHIVVDINTGKALIDTGSPATIGRTPFPFAGRDFPCMQEFMGVSLDAISAEIGMHIDWLVGADVLGKYQIEIDWLSQTLTVHEEPLGAGVGEPLRFVMGIPVISIMMNGKRVAMFFDTGAKISYAKQALIDTIPVSGSAHDFYPGFGSFETPIRQVPTSLAGADVMLTVGQLPDMLEATLLAAGVSGIVGNDIFTTYSKVNVDYLGRRFLVTR